MSSNQGYIVKQYSMPIKRYCQTLSLKNNPALLAEYRKVHSKSEAWPEIRKGIRSGNGNVHIRIASIHDHRNAYQF